MRDCHAILGQRASFVRANAGGGAKSLDRLKVLDEHKLLGHSLGSEGQRHGHSGEEALWHISHDDTNCKHKHIDGIVTHNGKTIHEERYAEDNSDGRDNDNESFNFVGKRRLLILG